MYLIKHGFITRANCFKWTKELKRKFILFQDTDVFPVHIILPKKKLCKVWVIYTQHEKAKVLQLIRMLYSLAESLQTSNPFFQRHCFCRYCSLLSCLSNWPFFCRTLNIVPLIMKCNWNFMQYWPILFKEKQIIPPFTVILKEKVTNQVWLYPWATLSPEREISPFLLSCP